MGWPQKICAALLVGGVLAGCRTTEEVLRDYDAEFTRGVYSRGACETAELAQDCDGDELLWHLLAGSAYRLDGDAQAAFREMEAADRGYGFNDTKGVFSRGATTTWAMMVNDTVFAYDGGGVDRVFTCLYKAIDFLAAGDTANARVDLNRAGQYQRNWLDDRKKEIAAAQKRFDADAESYIRSQRASGQGVRGSSQQAASVLKDDSLRSQFIQNCGFDPASDADFNTLASTKAFVNAYAMHVEGVFRWLNGDSDRGELRDAAAYLPRAQMARRDAAERRAGRFPRDQVWVYIEDGMCPVRGEWRTDLPLWTIPGAGDYLPYVGMAFPTLVKRQAACDHWRVEDNMPEQVCDVDALVKTEYDIYMKGAVTREITRTIIRAGMEVALGILADECARSHDKNKQNQFWIYKIAQIGVAVWAKACTKADTRSWLALPKRVLAVRIDRPASGRITIRANSETVCVELPPGNSMVFIRKPGAFAPSVVKKHTF